MEEKFRVQSWWWGFSNSCQSQCGPVQAESILPHGLSKLRLLRIIQSRVNPVISTKSNRFGKREIPAGIPVDDNKDVHDKVSNTEDVGVVGFSLCFGKELHHAPNPQKLVYADLWVVDAKDEVEDVSGQHGENIETKLKAADVSIQKQLLIFH